MCRRSILLPLLARRCHARDRRRVWLSMNIIYIIILYRLTVTKEIH